MKRKIVSVLCLCAALAFTVQAAETEIETEAVTEVATEAAEEAAEETTETATEAAEETTETATEAAGFDVKKLPAYVALDYVKLGEYKGIKVEVPAVNVTDDEVMAVVNTQTIGTITTGTVELGDIANIDYVGKKDGVAFDGGTAAGYNLGIGSNTFIEGFEDGLVGKEIGTTVDLPLKFPEQYHSEELAGAEVVFTVTINSVQRPQELTDELAAELKPGMTAEAYKESVRADITAQKEAANKDYAEEEIWTKVFEAAEITGYPEEHLAFSKERAMNYYTYVAMMYGMDLDAYLEAAQVSRDDFEAMVDGASETALGQQMTLLAVFEAENMELSDDEYAQGIATYASEQGQTPEDLEEAYGAEYLKSSLMQEKALSFLVENAEITTAE